MYRRGGKAIVETVGIPEEGEEVGYEGRYRAASSSQSLDYGSSRQRLVRYLQWAHGNGPATAEHYSSGLGIEVDVELGGGCGVTEANCSTHKRNGLDLGDDGRLAAYSGSDIGKRAGEHTFSALCVVLSSDLLPETVVMATNSISGWRPASRIAIASSWPGSQSRIILCFMAWHTSKRGTQSRFTILAVS